MVENADIGLRGDFPLWERVQTILLDVRVPVWWSRLRFDPSPHGKPFDLVAIEFYHKGTLGVRSQFGGLGPMHGWAIDTVRW